MKILRLKKLTDQERDRISDKELANLLEKNVSWLKRKQKKKTGYITTSGFEDEYFHDSNVSIIMAALKKWDAKKGIKKFDNYVFGLLGYTTEGRRAEVLKNELNRNLPEAKERVFVRSPFCGSVRRGRGSNYILPKNPITQPPSEHFLNWDKLKGRLGDEEKEVIQSRYGIGVNEKSLEEFENRGRIREVESEALHKMGAFPPGKVPLTEAKLASLLEASAYEAKCRANKARIGIKRALPKKKKKLSKNKWAVWARQKRAAVKAKLASKPAKKRKLVKCKSRA